MMRMMLMMLMTLMMLMEAKASEQPSSSLLSRGPPPNGESSGDSSGESSGLVVAHIELAALRRHHNLIRRHLRHLRHLIRRHRRRWCDQCASVSWTSRRITI
jgi:hypothetical protein